jgi:hypothetical protein
MGSTISSGLNAGREAARLTVGPVSRNPIFAPLRESEAVTDGGEGRTVLRTQFGAPALLQWLGAAIVVVCLLSAMALVFMQAWQTLWTPHAK